MIRPSRLSNLQTTLTPAPSKPFQLCNFDKLAAGEEHQTIRPSRTSIGPKRTRSACTRLLLPTLARPRSAPRPGGVTTKFALAAWGARVARGSMIDDQGRRYRSKRRHVAAASRLSGSPPSCSHQGQSGPRISRADSSHGCRSCKRAWRPQRGSASVALFF